MQQEKQNAVHDGEDVGAKQLHDAETDSTEAGATGCDSHGVGHVSDRQTEGRPAEDIEASMSNGAKLEPCLQKIRE